MRTRLVVIIAAALTLGTQVASLADERARLVSFQIPVPGAQLLEWLGIHRTQSITYTGSCGGAVYQGPNRVDCSNVRGTRPVCFSNGACWCAYDSHCD